MNAAKVESLDELKLLRAALCRFEEVAKTVLSDTEGELQRSLNWLETEAVSHWQGQIRSRKTALIKAKDALRAKKLFHADGFKPSVVDEEKAVRMAIVRLEEAEVKLVAVHHYAKELQKEMSQYKGQVQRFSNTVAIDIPIAVGRLDALLRHLEVYVGIRPTEEEVGVGAEASGLGESYVLDEGLASMARPEERAGEGQRDRETRGQGDEENDRGGEGERGGGGTPPDGGIHNPQSAIRNSEGGAPHGDV